MGFYATDQLDDVLESCQENPTPPSKNRVWNFFTTSETCAGFFESQPVELHQEKSPTPTTTASGVHYYGKDGFAFIPALPEGRRRAGFPATLKRAAHAAPVATLLDL